MELSIPALKTTVVETLKYLDSTHNAIGTWVLASALVLAAHLLEAGPLKDL